MGDKPEYEGFLRIAAWKNIEEKTGEVVLTCQFPQRFKLKKIKEKPKQVKQDAEF